MDLEQFLSEWRNESPVVLVHTSGSTGTPKPLWVEKRRMEASARITCRFLGLREGDTALLCMPLDYIAGKMMVVRALTCGLRLLSVAPSTHPLTMDDPIDFAAMVPLQVYHTLLVPEECERLKRIRHLIIGGGAIDEAMERRLQDFPNAVWSTYGMTETLSHIALRRLNGPARSDYYTPFEGVEVRLQDDGCLVIHAPAVCLEPLITNDRAELAPDGRSFRILGRRDNVVCSGGIKLQIEEIERKLRPHIQVPFLISKRRDPEFGEMVVLLVEDADRTKYTAVCQEVLAKYERPKLILSVERIPMTETGKPARKQAEELVSQSGCR
jgi:O-succinylbenzoic acid--CoA ligase